MHDTKHYMLAKSEERQYQSWVKEKKNQILSMSNTVKKQVEWQKLFPPMTRSDDYLKGNVF